MSQPGRRNGVPPGESLDPPAPAVETWIGARRIHPRLPIFRVETARRCVLYAAGRWMAVSFDDAARIERCFWGRSESAPDEELRALADWLIQQTRAAAAARRARLAAPYRPVSLTLYLSNRCDLQCEYCYAAAGGGSRHPRNAALPRLADDCVVAAARLVAANCRRRNELFTLVVHGGGEPTIHWRQVERCLRLVRQAAAEHEVPLQTYLATHGAVTAKLARRLAMSFDRVGISCDGPPAIQDRQRPRAGGRPTSAAVERTARLLRAAGVALEARATITPRTMDRQAEIAAYLCELFPGSVLRFEPVYRQPADGGRGFRPSDAARFAGGFLAAQRVARAQGCELRISGVRPAEAHGPFCPVLADNLLLTPGGWATACFFAVDDDPCDDRRAGALVGTEFLLDQDRCNQRRRRAARWPRECRQCLNVGRCARNCPDQCAADEPAQEPRRGESSSSFRCRLYQRLTAAWIIEDAAAHTPPPEERELPPESRRGNRAADRLLELVDASGAAVDRLEILEQWTAAAAVYSFGSRRLPQPLWAERPYERHGGDAWREVRKHCRRPGAERGLSIYLHVPFCDRQCGFCDCYAIPLRRHRAAQEERFVAALEAEIAAWARVVGPRNVPPTTVHFGGGSPGDLPADLLERLLRRLRDGFALAPTTELALESAATRLTAECLAGLWQLGFRRLHLGVQTLEDGVRAAIGRRGDAAETLARLAACLRMGFVTTVDVVYGLPGQTPAGFVETLDRLTAAGVHGVSLYQLNVSARNRRFLQASGQVNDPLRAFAFLAVGERTLRNAGYGKNHFTHYAKPADRNLYVTHPLRGEDLLALGPTADGVFGDCRYRHPAYRDYLRAAVNRGPWLEGSIVTTDAERRVSPLVQALMCARPTRAALARLGAAELADFWLAHALLAAGPTGSPLTLTAAGSWFVADMIRDLAAAVDRADGRTAKPGQPSPSGSG